MFYKTHTDSSLNPNRHANQPKTPQRRLPVLLALLGLMIAFPGIGQANPAKAMKTTVNPKFAETGDTPTGKWAKGRLLVIPRAGLPAAEFDKAIMPHGVKSKLKLKGLNAHIYELPDGVDEVKVLNKLKKDRRFKAVELDMLVEPAQTVTDPAFNNSWALPKIQAPTAWQTATGDGITIAILDTGVNGNHPDLAANMVPGWNIYNNNADTTDVHGHGTLVAGSAAAVANNGHGSVGVAWDARIMPVRIADANAYAYFSAMASGIRWAADNGAKIANISYHGAAGSLTVQSAANYMRNKGGIVVVSAGNTSGYINYASSDALLVVSATSSNDARASWSSYGPSVDLAAPGVSIYTTTRGGGYGYASGTSFSSPIVAATAALMLAANPDLAPTDVDSILKTTALDLGDPGHDHFYGHGRINAASAVEAAYARLDIDNIPPVISITSPTGGEVSGSVPVDVNYSDNKAVVRVELHVNGHKTITDTEAPFAFVWDTTQLADGNHILTAHAFDAAGNEGISSPVSVTVNNTPVSDTPELNETETKNKNEVETETETETEKETDPPVITHFNLRDEQRVKRNENVRISASDNTQTINFRVNGNIIATSRGNSLNFRWTTWDSAPRGSSLIVMVEASNTSGDTIFESITVQN
ncbi:MAG TPA: S8 family serine peptidase [Nitrosomonas halophila]|nr:S8 family serine peptidase [Nitrosomonas halophila]